MRKLRSWRVYALAPILTTSSDSGAVWTPNGTISYPDAISRFSDSHGSVGLPGAAVRMTILKSLSGSSRSGRALASKTGRPAPSFIDLQRRSSRTRELDGWRGRGRCGSVCVGAPRRAADRTACLRTEKGAPALFVVNMLRSVDTVSSAFSSPPCHIDDCDGGRGTAGGGVAASAKDTASRKLSPRRAPSSQGCRCP